MILNKANWELARTNPCGLRLPIARALRKLRIGELSGPRTQVDSIGRIRKRVETEQRQLPSDLPNVIVVDIQKTCVLGLGNIGKTISELEEGIYDYPHLLSTIVREEYIGITQPETTMKDNHIFVKKNTSDFIIDQALILFNRFCELKVSPATITRMQDAFIKY